MNVSQEMLTILAFFSAFLIIIGVGMLTLYLFGGNNWRAVTRLRQLSELPLTKSSALGEHTVVSAVLPKLGTFLVPRRASRLRALKARLAQAGYYNPQTANIFLGVQFLLLVSLSMAATVPVLVFGLLSPWHCALCALAGLCLGWLAPNLWLGTRQNKRQRLLRRALPDALDMLVLCVEGGISLQGALQRVTAELHLAHPALADEMNIVQREIELGLAAGEAMRHLAERCGLTEVRHLASLLLQADRYGAGVTGSLRIGADELRVTRKQEAEEKAQKAAVKILFPMLLCIFPVIFIVLLGPAAIQLKDLFAD